MFTTSPIDAGSEQKCRENLQMFPFLSVLLGLLLPVSSRYRTFDSTTNRSLRFPKICRRTRVKALENSRYQQIQSVSNPIWSTLRWLDPKVYSLVWS